MDLLLVSMHVLKTPRSFKQQKGNLTNGGPDNQGELVMVIVALFNNCISLNLYEQFSQLIVLFLFLQPEHLCHVKTYPF